MNKNTDLRSRIAAASPRVGGSSFLRQLKEIPRKTNTDGTTTEKEGIVEKLQGVLVAVRRDRDREHRSRDIAMEKLRSAKEAFEIDKSNLETEKEKLAKTQEEAERIQKEIKEKEESIRQLQEKVCREMISNRDNLLFWFSLAVFLTFAFLRRCSMNFVSINFSTKI